jgi:hypothetical protein
MTALPAVDTSLPGAGCLLCMAAASIANSDLTKHAKTLGLEDLPALKQTLAERIRAKGGEAVVIDEPLVLDKLEGAKATGPNLAKKDFTPLKKKYAVDKLLVVQISTLGFERTYSAYVPTSDPKGAFVGLGYMVNLGSNAYEWYQPITVYKSADGKWDEPPKFPGLTNAYYQAVELGKDSFLRPFSQ